MIKGRPIQSTAPRSIILTTAAFTAAFLVLTACILTSSVAQEGAPKSIVNKSIVNIDSNISNSTSDNNSSCFDAQCAINFPTLEDLEQKVTGFSPDPSRPDEKYMLITLQEALFSAREGNYAVGACLVNKTSGEVIERGRNRVFYPYFRSDLHAEMDVLNRYEERVRANSSRTEGLVLYCTVEPSVMGLSRIIASGVKEVHYLVSNSDGALPMEQMPRTWRDLAQGMVYAQADCTPELLDLSYQVFYYNSGSQDEKLKTSQEQLTL